MSLPKPALDGDDSTEPPVPRPQLGADVSGAGDKPTFLLETSGLGWDRGSLDSVLGFLPVLCMQAILRLEKTFPNTILLFKLARKGVVNLGLDLVLYCKIKSKNKKPKKPNQKTQQKRNQKTLKLKTNDFQAQN